MKNLNTNETLLTAAIDGIGVLGPGLVSWTQAQQILRGEQIYRYEPAIIPAATLLPPAERRRAVPIVKLTLAAGLEAVAHAQGDAASLATVFSSSSGDAQNMHAICATLATSEREISPTRFHNSVHNSAAGYWSIATGATAASTALCAYDGSFAAGLLEALATVRVERKPVLLFVYDIDYPQPLRHIRPIADAFCVAMVLAPQRSANTLAQIAIRLESAPVTAMQFSALEQLRTAVPAARSLSLLEKIATARNARVVLDYLDDLQLRVDIAL